MELWQLFDGKDDMGRHINKVSPMLWSALSMLALHETRKASNY